MTHAIGTISVGELRPGPCCICGATDYALSCGGPTICPKCDCGHFDAATVIQQAKVIGGLRESNAELLAALKGIIQQDDDAARAKDKPGANLNGVGLVDLFDCVGHPLGVGEHKQSPYRSVNLDVALQDARVVIAKNDAAIT